MPFYVVRINDRCLFNEKNFKSKINAKKYFIKKAKENGKEFNKYSDSYKKFILTETKNLELYKKCFEDEDDESDDSNSQDLFH